MKIQKMKKQKYIRAAALLLMVATFQISVAQQQLMVNCPTTILVGPTPAVITTDPLNQSGNEGSDLYFHVEASGDDVLVYQWQYFDGSGWDNITNTGAYSGADTDSLKITGLQLSFDGNLYRCIVNNGCNGDTSQYATLRLLQPVPIGYNGDTLWVSPVDNAQGFSWGGTGTLVNAFDTVDGRANTDKITAELGAGGYAASVCDTLNAYGFSDWYLPANDELKAMSVFRDSIGGFDPAYYWSSTEYDATTAWFIFINTGYSDHFSKDNSYYVRCVRNNNAPQILQPVPISYNGDILWVHPTDNSTGIEWG
ncbi:MAG: DUF1566 domain-containing protein, partial [Bacteroidetes bacterium]|nr:DUF1566 domain-containing protein [Bacteroidota bacterium]